MKTTLSIILITIFCSFKMEKTIRVKLINKCSYDLSLSCPGYSIIVQANSYSNTDLPAGTEINIKKYGDSQTSDKLYLEEKDSGREIVVCR